MSMAIYAYRKDTGIYEYSDIGNADYLLDSLTDGLDFTLTPPPDHEHVWRWADDKWVADEPELSIQDIRADVWERIKAKRYEEITSGVLVKSVNKVFHTDEMSAMQYAHVAGAIALDNYEPKQWKVMDNTWVLLTVPLFKELQAAMQESTQANYTNAEKHLHALNLTDSPADYDYSTGWTRGN